MVSGGGFEAQTAHRWQLVNWSPREAMTQHVTEFHVTPQEVQIADGLPEDASCRRAGNGKLL